MKASVGILVSTLALTGCATNQKTACLQQDWEALGFNHGQAGYAQAARTAELSNCQSYPAHFDQHAYDNGYQKGLRNYCSKESAYQKGHTQQRFNPNMCPSEHQPVLINRYHLGRNKTLTKKTQTLSNLLDDLDHALIEYKKETTNLKRNISAERAYERIHFEIKKIKRQIRQIQEHANTPISIE